MVATGVYAFLELPRLPRATAATTGSWGLLCIHELREGIDDTGVRAAFLKSKPWRIQHGLIGDVPRILALGRGGRRRDGRAGHGAHRGQHLRRPAFRRSRTLTGRRGRPGPDRDRARRRQQRSPLPTRPGGPQGPGSAATGSTSSISTPRRSASRRSSRCSARATRNASTSGTTQRASWTSSAHNPPFADERPDYLHITHNVLPTLLEAGVTQEQIDVVLVENPRRFFGPTV